MHMKRTTRIEASADCTARNGASRRRRSVQEAGSTPRRDPAPTGADSDRSHHPGAEDSHPSAPGPNTGEATLTRVVRLEIADCEPRAARGQLEDLARRLQQAANALVWHWLDFHRQAGTAERLHALHAWYRAGKPAGQRPPPAGPACPPELQRAWYYLLRDQFGDLHQRPRDLLLNWLAGTLREQDSPQRAKKRWQCVLLGQERPAAFLQPLPIRVDAINSRLEQDGRSLALVTRLARLGGKSEPVKLRLLSPRNNDSRSTAEYRAQWQLAAEVAAGQRKLLGSQLAQHGGKWFLMLTVQSAAELAAVEPQFAAVLRPGRRDPWRLRANLAGRVVRGGFGRTKHRGERQSLLEAVGELRERILLQRARLEGINAQLPAPRKFTGSRGAWNRACTNINRETAARVAAVICAERIGRVTLIAGNGASLLETAGKQEDIPDTTSFPFHQFFRFLKEILEPRGVTVKVRASLRSAKRRQTERRQAVAR